MITISNLKEMAKNKDESKKTQFQSELEEYKLSLSDYDESQDNVLNSTENAYIVKGAAGSGKSLLAMIKLFELEGKGANYNIIIYTIALKRFLQGKLKRAQIKDVETKIFYESEYEKIILDENIDYVIIDEIQDFALSDIDKYIKSAKVGYYLFGDSAQQIYPKKTLNEDIINEIIKKYSTKSYELKITYRFPKKIALFAEQINKKAFNLSEKCKKVGSDENMPKIIEFKSINDEINYIYNAITNETWKSVGILVRRNDNVNCIYNNLMDKGLLCEYKNDKDDTLDFSTDKPKIITYHSSKGLEFERVFIPQCDVFEEKDKSGNYLYNYREALYVSFTRASKTLIVSYITGKKSVYLDEISSKYYEFEKR